MNINKEKCNAWFELLISLMKMTKEINKDEARYIKANFAIAFGNLELQELEEKNKQSLDKNENGD